MNSWPRAIDASQDAQGWRQQARVGPRRQRHASRNRGTDGRTELVGWDRQREMVVGGRGGREEQGMGIGVSVPSLVGGGAGGGACAAAAKEAGIAMPTSSTAATAAGHAEHHAAIFIRRRSCSPVPAAAPGKEGRKQARKEAAPTTRKTKRARAERNRATPPLTHSACSAPSFKFRIFGNATNVRARGGRAAFIARAFSIQQPRGLAPGEPPPMTRRAQPPRRPGAPARGAARRGDSNWPVWLVVC